VTISLFYQATVAVIVITAFWVDVIETQIMPHVMLADDDPRNSVEFALFLWIDITITSFFTIDLAANIFGNSDNLLQGFCKKFMNWLDVVVVVASIACVVLAALGHEPFPLKIIRLVRVMLQIFVLA